MTTFYHSCEGADETDVIATTGAPAGSDNWPIVEKVGSATIKFDTALSAAGVSSMRFAATATGERSSVRWNLTATDKVSTRFYAYLPSQAGTGKTLFALQTSSALTVMSLYVSSTGNIILTDGAGGTTASPGTMSLNTWYRFEVLVDRTIPSFSVAVYAGHATSPTSNLSFSYGPAVPNPGPDKAARAVFGRYASGSTLAYTVWLDDIKLVTDSVAPIGPASSSAVANYDITADYPANSEEADSWKVDTTASTGATTLQHVSGPVPTITESPTGIFLVSNPASAGNIELELVADQAGSIAVKNVTIARGSGVDKPFQYTFLGGNPADIANWA